ncbi:MAG: class I SAM-dependent methyltransferase [Dehalococcoidia bacterium]|nr:class I SAM-dependent methyltransferase [Dehalococcoidia bacterium]
MARPRVPETESGITGEFTCEVYNEMQRGFRDRGWIETKDVIKAGITSGHALEVGPGPGYLGLEWLKMTEGTMLTGLDISADMIAVAQRNAKEYGFQDRVTYVESAAHTMPFDDNHFDAVFTNGSLHEWADPAEVMNEIARVLKPNGSYFISDLRRDMNPLLRGFMWMGCKPKQMRPGLTTSINAAYTPAELRGLVNTSKLPNPMVSSNAIGVNCWGCAGK